MEVRKQMRKKAEAKAVMISFVVAALVAIILIPTIEDLRSKNVDTQTQYNDAITYNNATAQSLTYNDLTANASCNCTPYYTYLAGGTVLIENDSCTGQAGVCNYTYHDSAYINSPTARTILNLNTIFYALVIIVGIVSVYGMSRK